MTNVPSDDPAPGRIHRPAKDHNIRHELGPDRISILTFDRDGSSANVLDEDSLRALANKIDWIGNHPHIRGLVITSAKPGIFIAGADLTALRSASPEEAHSLIALGQEVFQRLAELNIPTVAAIHGACVGGGLELALACDYRIATDAKVTRLGLPETKLGILPAWGGTTRLPRLIGLPAALRLILTGKLIDSSRAKKLGIVDDVAPRHRLIEHASSFLSRGPGRKPERKLVNVWPFPTLIRLIQNRAIKRKTYGNYPSFETALKVATKGILVSEEESLRLERRAATDLAQTPGAKNLIRTFFLQERSKKSPPGSEEYPIRNTAVVGGGLMGSGIAAWFASKGHRVILHEIGRPELALGMKRAAGSIALARSKGVLSHLEARDTRDRISPATTPVPLKNTDLVVEAAVEIPKIKKEIFADLASRARDDTILATNTSSLSVTEIAESDGVTHPERIIGLHFFNPVARMKLVEVVVTRHTADDVLARALTFVRSIGKLPVVVNDAPGFVVNRILVPYLVAAGDLYNQGSPPGDIDRAMLAFGMPMGPLRLLDEIGIDIALHVARSLESGFGKDRMPVPAILERMVEAGLMGRKVGEGFYSHAKKKKPRPNPVASSLRHPSIDPHRSAKDITPRLIIPMLVEASRCLHEGVVNDPRDIDFAMILGTGFAPFRGGPLRYADRLGADHILTKCQEFGLPPGPLLPDLKKRHSTFY